MAKRKIFLTGVPGVGKTTIINRFVSELALLPAGFSTVVGGASVDGSTDKIFIIPYGKPLVEAQNILPAAVRDKNKMTFQAYPDVFDTLGQAILKASRGAELIIMDELGFMESAAFSFQNEVFACLGSDTPILGVIKPMQIPFLDRIRAHEAVQILEVTAENRNQVLEMLLRDFKPTEDFGQ
jgi:nucleoside-triphosphatase